MAVAAGDSVAFSCSHGEQSNPGAEELCHADKGAEDVQCVGAGAT